MPWATHPTIAITGSQCLAACALVPGTVAEGLARPVERSPAVINIEHPMGDMAVTVDFSRDSGGFQFNSTGVVRTARLIAKGEVMVPADILVGRTSATS